MLINHLHPTGSPSSKYSAFPGGVISRSRTVPDLGNGLDLKEDVSARSEIQRVDRKFNLQTTTQRPVTELKSVEILYPVFQKMSRNSKPITQQTTPTELKCWSIWEWSSKSGVWLKNNPQFDWTKKSNRLKHGERLQLRTATAAVSGLRYCRTEFLVMENSVFFLPKWPFFW